MKITEIRIRKTFENSVLRAIVSVTFDSCFTVHDIKIINVNSGFIIVMPNKKTKDGRLSDVCHPINKEFRRVLEEEILKEYLSFIEAPMP